MARIHIYLNFDGNCEEAFRFYEKVFQSPNLGIFRYGDMPSDNDSEELPASIKDKVLHTALQINEHSMLMGSDIAEMFGSHPLKKGNQTYAMVEPDTIEDTQRIYNELSAEALEIEMPLERTFFAELYASLQDQFGIWWMIHYEGNASMS